MLKTKALADGLYRVVFRTLCAGFVVENGRVVKCAPVLRKRLDFWVAQAERIAL